MSLKLKRQRKQYPAKCYTPRCRGRVPSRSRHSDKCDKCRREIYKNKHPLKEAFGSLRRHARARGKDFTLTFEQFKAFAEKTDYMKRKGKTSLSLSIDRIDNSKGYAPGNIQAITLRENTRKQYVPSWREYQERTMAETQREIAEFYGI